MDRQFWRGKKVFLTGHTGFKGGHLALWLQSAGASVTGYALPPPTSPALFEAARVGEGMESITADVRDADRLQAALAAHQPEIVLHLAAQPLVRRAYVIPVETYATNVMGSVHLLEAVRHTPAVRVVIMVTSDKCYENKDWVWGYRENDRLGGRDPYANSKACAELVTAAYRQSFFPPERGVAIASVRAGNVIGGGDWAEDRLIPDIVRAIVAGQPVVIRYPNALRPWQHVLEPLHGYLMLAERLWQDGAKMAGGWNFGPREQDARPVSWIVERMARRWGPEVRWEIASQVPYHEDRYLRLDSSKAMAELGWQPRLRLPEALDWLMDWYRQWRGGADMRKVSLDQIAAYEARPSIDTEA